MQTHTQTLEEVTEKFCRIARENIGADRVNPTDSLIYDLSMDSLDLVEFVMAVEEEFDQDVPDDELEKLELKTLTVADAAKAFYKQFLGK